MRKLQRFFTLAVLLSLSAWLVAGCTPRDTENKGGKNGHSHGDEHELGPNGGIIVEWLAGGKHLHAELVIKRKDKKLIVHVLNEDNKAYPIDAEEVRVNLSKPKVHTFTLKPEGSGKSSKYVLDVKEDWFETAGDMKGEVTATFGGKSQKGPFDESKLEKDHKD